MAQLFLGGIPTGPDVKLLREAFGLPQPGTEIEHAQIERVLGIKRDKGRYRVVTDAWRSELMRDDGIHLGALPGVGFRALTPDERVGTNVGTFKRGVRAVGRSLRRLALTPTAGLSMQSATKRDHALRLGGAVFHQAQSVVRQLAAPEPQQQTSQLKAPQK